MLNNGTHSRAISKNCRDKLYLSNHHAASFRFKCGVQIYIKGNELLHALHPQIVDDVVVDMSINNVFIQATRYVQNLCKYVKQIQ